MPKKAPMKKWRFLHVSSKESPGSRVKFSYTYLLTFYFPVIVRLGNSLFYLLLRFSFEKWCTQLLVSWTDASAVSFSKKLANFIRQQKSSVWRNFGWVCSEVQCDTQQYIFVRSIGRTFTHTSTSRCYCPSLEAKP